MSRSMRGGEGEPFSKKVSLSPLIKMLSSHPFLAVATGQLHETGGPSGHCRGKDMTIGGPDPAAHQTIPAVALGIAAHARALAQAQGMSQTAADGGRLVAEGVVELMSAQDRALGK